VDKVENKRYDSALLDTLSALVTIYGDYDPIQVRQHDDHGALNIEVKSQHGLDPLYEDHMFSKTSPNLKHNLIGGRGGANHAKNSSAGNGDLKFVSPIAARRVNMESLQNSSTECPGDETKELAEMVKPPRKPRVPVQPRRSSRQSAKQTSETILDQKKPRPAVAFGKTTKPEAA